MSEAYQTQNHFCSIIISTKRYAEIKKITRTHTHKSSPVKYAKDLMLLYLQVYPLSNLHCSPSYLRKKFLMESLWHYLSHKKRLEAQETGLLCTKKNNHTTMYFTGGHQREVLFNAVNWTYKSIVINVSCFFVFF